MRRDPQTAGLVLLVTADSAYRRQVKESLAAEGVRFSSVASPAEALAALENVVVDVLLIDLASGTALARDALVRAVHERDEATAIIITADQVGEAVLIHALRQGINDYIPKGAPPVDLAASLADALGAAAEKRRRAVELADLRQSLDEHRQIPVQPAIEGARALAVDLLADIEAARTAAHSAAVDPLAATADDLRAVLMEVSTSLSCVAAKLDCLRPPRVAPNVRANVPSAISSAAGLCEACHEASRLGLRVNMPGPVPRVRCPQPALERIMVGMLCFAASEAASRDGGSVIVTAREARGGVTISVADNGPGITPANVLSQSARFGAGRVGSVPLLLLICAARACEAVGGTATVRAKAGRGTAVEVWLPADADSPKDYPPPSGGFWRHGDRDVTG